MANNDAWDLILSKYFEGAIAPEELKHLEEKLLRDNEFADYVAQWCVMHRQIGDLLAEDRLHELMDQFVTRPPALRQELFKQESSATRSFSKGESSLGTWRRGNLVRIAAIASAALLLGAASIVFFATRQNRPDTALSQPASNPRVDVESGPARLATLTQLNGAVWPKDAKQFHHGEQLVVGSRIVLESGMAKITFDCGAEVVLEGPCDFVTRKPMLGYLKYGKITADVPRRAFAFAILSPEVDFVDLGTSFGLSVGDRGHTELHVFKGEVLCSRTNDDDRIRNPVYHVTANNAVEFRTNESRPADIALNKGQFSEHIELRQGTVSHSSRLPGEGLALWLSADNGVTTDSRQGVISWRDSLYGDNQSGEDAIQVEKSARPRLVPDVFAGRPAIRFDGQADYLLTTPLATTDDQTVALVCRFSESALDKTRRWGGQILNYDGPPSRYLSDTLEPGVLQIGEPLLETDFKPTLLSAQVFAGFIGSATVESGRVDTKPVGINVPVIVTYRYDLSHGRASLAINGEAYGETRAFAPQAITSRKIIGRHAWMQNFFHGDLAELLIYNKALAPKELNETTSYLADKYSIKLEPAAGAP
jgi:hypothetical protein